MTVYMIIPDNVVLYMYILKLLPLMQIVDALPRGMEALISVYYTGLYNQSYTVELTHDMCTRSQ